MSDLGREFELWVVGPGKSYDVRLRMVGHGEGQGTRLVDKAVTKLDQIWLGSCKSRNFNAIHNLNSEKKVLGIRKTMEFQFSCCLMSQSMIFKSQ